MADTSIPPHFSVTALSGGYPQLPVLHDVSFTAETGEIIGIFGHNGMGKTTLLKTLIGVLPSVSGEITLQGHSLTGRPSHERARAGLGYVAQGREIFPGLTSRENIAFGAAACGFDPNNAVARAVEDFPILERLLDRKGGALSGGEQQILALARALAGQPSVLLLDEPTEGVAPTIVEDIEEQLLRLVKDAALTVIVVEQDVEFLTTVSSRILKMQKGVIHGEIDPAALNDSQLFGLPQEAALIKGTSDV